VHFARSGIGMNESHVAQLAAAFTELFNHGALIGFGTWMVSSFIGFEDFVPLPVDNHFRLRDLQLVSSRAFVRSRRRDAARRGRPRGTFRTIRFLRAQRYVGFEFFEESIAQMPRGQVLPFPSGERAIVTERSFGQLVLDRDSGQCDRMFRVSNRIPMLTSFRPATATILLPRPSISVRSRPE